MKPIVLPEELQQDLRTEVAQLDLADRGRRHSARHPQSRQKAVSSLVVPQGTEKSLRGRLVGAAAAAILALVAFVVGNDWLLALAAAATGAIGSIRLNDLWQWRRNRR
jgi:hypothetical protein